VASALEKKVNREASADSSGTTCDVMVCLIVSSTPQLTSNWDRRDQFTHVFIWRWQMFLCRCGCFDWSL